MKIKSIITILIVFGVVFNAPVAFAQSGTITSKAVNFDKNKFVTGVKSNFDGKVKGYQVVLLKNGQIAAEYADGEARTKIDGQAAMTINTPANIGSTAKFFGGVALLKLFSSPKGYLNPSGRSVDGWLNEKIYFYLPEIWKDNMHPSWKEVTFRELLQHKSGVRAFTKAERDAYKAQGITMTPYHYFLKELKPENRGVRDYENFNFSVLTYLIPVIADPTLRGTINMEVAKQKLKPEDMHIRQRLGNAFEGYMRGKLFEKITPNIFPSCDAPNEYPKQNKIYAKAYDSVSDATKGFEWSERVQNGSCYAQGGWYVTGRELAAFVASFTATETLVPNAVETKMFNDEKADENLVWSFTTGDKWITDNFGMKTLPYMGGDHDGSHATILKLPNGYHAVGIINSSDMGSGGVTTAIINAFKSSITF